MSDDKPLRWKRVQDWDLSTIEQLIWMADGLHVGYKITRSGTADKPSWNLYTRREGGIEERLTCSNRLADAKHYAQSVERHTLQNH
jgi:hypothetical protein